MKRFIWVMVAAVLLFLLFFDGKAYGLFYKPGYRSMVRTLASLPRGTDFTGFYIFGTLYVRGVDRIYDPETFRAQAASVGLDAHVAGDFRYPPPSLPIMALLARGSYLEAYERWLIVLHACFLVLGLCVAAVAPFRRAWARWVAGGVACVLFAMSPMAIENYFQGQITPLVMAFIALSIACYHRRLLLGAAVFAVLATMIKISPILLFVAYVLRREWRLLGYAAAFTAAWVAASVAFFGLDAYADYARMFGSFRLLAINRLNPSPVAAACGLLLPYVGRENLAALSQGLTVGMLAIAFGPLAWLHHRVEERVDGVLEACVCVAAIPLVVSFSWPAHMVMSALPLCVALCWLLRLPPARAPVAASLLALQGYAWIILVGFTGTIIYISRIPMHEFVQDHQLTMVANIALWLSLLGLTWITRSPAGS